MWLCSERVVAEYVWMRAGVCVVLCWIMIPFSFCSSKVVMQWRSEFDCRFRSETVSWDSRT
jgi:hypothetical protein